MAQGKNNPKEEHTPTKIVEGFVGCGTYYYIKYITILF
jgi:hypothetical protein